MSEASIDGRSAPSSLLLGLTAVAATGISLAAWLLIALGTIFSWLWGAEWLYTGLALPAATVGAVVAHITRRPVCFWVGIAITLIPLIAYALLEVTASPPPPGWND